MMNRTLSALLTNCPVKQLIGNADISIETLVFDSRQAQSGSVFFALSGTQSDGHDFIGKALQQGSVAVVCERMPEHPADGITWVQVESSAYCLAQAASAFYDHPSRKLKLVGVTGTNGKTTIATLLYALFSQAGFPSGLISTIQYLVDKKAYPATHTTPDPLTINKMLAEMVDLGCSHAFMEVSSHAMAQMRTFGLHFSGGIFTNLTHDHLDYHGSFAAYRDAKKLFFDLLPQEAFALVNTDDRNGRYMTQNTRAQIFSYAIRSDADFKARVLENQFEGLLLNIMGKEVMTRLIGRFNAYNLLAIYGAARLLGMPEEEALTGISKLQSASGRFEYVRSGAGITGIVDYAHTPDALENVLSTINEIRTHNEKLITIVGAGGNRDRTKRPEMARISCMLSDVVILTSDNPRWEDPNEILNEMRAGVPAEHYKKTIVIPDRREAIQAAVNVAAKGDIILLAGKGHEDYQEIQGKKFHFDDKEELFGRLLNA
ncbi:MAG TPA: UDP-N-acetylmuramoyl-L-alanyl-D-glutamate--2,6-diaminopimelate ligase [Bacteroidales bacterium]|nr:UDP-N-acetylmuramoyl-L-alanyl-D-glutamate--2,6-diaminopimelate ligase [Bacteroidales bacterium]